MKRVIATIIFALSVNLIFAQHTISGLITDQKDKDLLLSGVKVFVPEFDRVDESEEGGTYLLKNVGIGIVHVQFVKKGYRTVVQVVDTKDSATVINVEMVKDLGPEATISSVGPFMPLPSNSPFAVAQYDANRLHRMGNPKLLTSLMYEPGVDAITIGQISKPVIRGMSGSNILLIQSGSRILTNPLDERYDYELIDNGTSEVEILKGPAALMYGDNAMGGVMIFKDEKMPAPGMVVGDIGLGFNSNSVGLRTDAGIKGNSKRGLFYSFRMGGASHTSYIQGEGSNQQKNTEQKKFAYNSGWVAGDLKGIIGTTGKWGESKLTATYWKKQHELIETFTEDEVDTMDQSSQRDRKTAQPFVGQEAILLSLQNSILVGKAKLDVNVSWQNYHRESTYKTTATNYDVRYTTNPSRKMGLSFGSQGYFQDKDYTTYYSISQNKLLSNSLYAIYRYDLEKFNILAGVRYDMKKLTTPSETLNEDYNFINGSVGVAFHPTSNITIKLNGASGNSVPNEERYYYNRMYYGYLYSSDIKEQVNYEGDLGFEWRHPFFSFSLEGFYNKILDYTHIEYVLFTSEDYQLQQDDATMLGGEAKLSLHPTSVEWLNLNIGFSYIDAKYDSIDSDLYAPSITANKLVTGLRFQSKRMNYLYNGYIEILMRNYLPGNNPYILDYTLLDLHFGGSFHWGMQSFDISLALNNLLDQEYHNNLSLTRYLSPAVLDMGRNVSLMVRFPFGISSSK